MRNENQRHLKEHSVWALGQGLGTLPEQLGTLVRHFNANAQLGPVHSVFTPQGCPQGICFLYHWNAERPSSSSDNMPASGTRMAARDPGKQQGLCR